MKALESKWRHFRVIGFRRKREDDKDGEVRVKGDDGKRVELTSTCGPVENRIRMCISVKELKDRKCWEAGWTTMKELGDGRSRTVCRRCRGLAEEPCSKCHGLGKIGFEM